MMFDTTQQVKTRTSRKQKIYESAAILFQEKGYSATSMRDIANAVALEPSSLYSHIKSKQELLKDICFECANRFLRGLDQISTTTPHSDAQSMASSLIDLHISIAKEDLTSMTVFNDEWKHLEEPSLSEFKALRKHYEEASLQVIESGITSGVFRPIDKYLVLNTIVNSSLLIQRSKRLFRKSKETLTTEVSDLIFNGLVNAS